MPVQNIRAYNNLIIRDYSPSVSVCSRYIGLRVFSRLSYLGMNRFKLYCKFRDAFVCAHPDTKKDAAYTLAQERRNECKHNEGEVKACIRTRTAKRKGRESQLLHMWARLSKPKDVHQEEVSRKVCDTNNEASTSESATEQL